MAAERDPYQVLGVSRFDAWPEIRAGYRSLARRYHADGTSPDGARMVEINAAYACLERVHVSARPTASAAPGVPVGPGQDAPAPQATGSLYARILAARRIDTPVVDFGQYAGLRIAEIAECDPRYLRWLSRHSSGHRFRAAIEQVLGPDQEIGRRAALVR